MALNLENENAKPRKKMKICQNLCKLQYCKKNPPANTILLQYIAIYLYCNYFLRAPGSDAESVEKMGLKRKNADLKKPNKKTKLDYMDQGSLEEMALGLLQ